MNDKRQAAMNTFISLCKNLDWQFQYIDNLETWRIESAHYDQLKRMAEEGPAEWRTLFDCFWLINVGRGYVGQGQVVTSPFNTVVVREEENQP